MLGQILIAQGALSADKLAEALAEQRRRAARGTPVKLGELLIDMRLIRPEDLTRALAKHAQRVNVPAH